MKRHQGKRGKARILLVDDHPIVRERLAELINQQDDLMVCGECSEAHECVELLKTVRPDLVIIDLSLKSTPGIDLIKDLRGRVPTLPMLVLSMHEEAVYAERALRAGARGYVTKLEATQTIMTGIRRVLAGEIYLSQKMAAQLVGLFIRGYEAADRGASTARLTDRELQIYELIGRSYPTKQIAESLKIDVKTVDTHRSRLKEKLNLATIDELRASAIRWVSRPVSSTENPPKTT